MIHIFSIASMKKLTFGSILDLTLLYPQHPGNLTKKAPTDDAHRQLAVQKIISFRQGGVQLERKTNREGAKVTQRMVELRILSPFSPSTSGSLAPLW